MSNAGQIPISSEKRVLPLVFVARRGAERAFSMTRLAGSSWAEAEGEHLFGAVDRHVRATGNSLAEHWAFGGMGDADLDGLVSLPARPIAPGSGMTLRVCVQRSEAEANATVIVLWPETLAQSRGEGPHAREDPNCRICRTAEATKGLWSLAGCCRYLYETDSQGVPHLHVIEGPFTLIYGVELNELVMPTFALFLRNILPEDRPFPGAVQEILEASGSWLGSYRVKGTDGNIRHMRHLAVRHQEGGSVFVSGLMLDESAAAYAKQEASILRLSIENSREGFGITDAVGRFTYLNQELARLFGYVDAGDLLGREWSTLYRPAEVGFLTERIPRELDNAGFWHGHLLALRKDGATFQQDVTVSKTASGGYVCICRDRSQELEISARLEESETMLRALFDALPMGIVIRDEFGTRQFANGFMLREDALGVVGIPDTDLIKGASDWEKRQVEADANVLETGKSFEFVAESVIAQQVRWLHCIVFLVPAASGGVRRLGTLIMDVTRQKKIEQEARSLAERRREFLEMQREFISMVSHEFRTPLTTIRGAQFLLQKLFKRSKGMNRPVVESAEKWLGLQESALETLGKLVDQVLMLNRIEHMTGEASLDQLSPTDVIAETVARFNESMDSPRVALRDEVPRGYVASMDPGLVKAATENLISNGLKYSPLDRTVKVLVRVERDGWVVEVSDSGRGIPAGDHANLFRPFFRARNVGAVHGTGLGLAIVRRAVNYHGGRVEFESSEDSGTRFTLHFPGVAHPLSEEAALGHVPLVARKDGNG